jgi:hypothetical protein
MVVSGGWCNERLLTITLQHTYSAAETKHNFNFLASTETNTVIYSQRKYKLYLQLTKQIPAYERPNTDDPHLRYLVLCVTTGLIYDAPVDIFVLHTHFCHVL